MSMSPQAGKHASSGAGPVRIAAFLERDCDGTNIELTAHRTAGASRVPKFTVTTLGEKGTRYYEKGEYPNCNKGRARGV